MELTRDHAAISAAIREVEAHTSGQIVCVLAHNPRAKACADPLGAHVRTYHSMAAHRFHAVERAAFSRTDRGLSNRRAGVLVYATAARDGSARRAARAGASRRAGTVRRVS